MFMNELQSVGVIAHQVLAPHHLVRSFSQHIDILPLIQFTPVSAIIVLLCSTHRFGLISKEMNAGVVVLLDKPQTEPLIPALRKHIKADLPSCRESHDLDYSYRVILSNLWEDFCVRVSCFLGFKQIQADRLTLRTNYQNDLDNSLLTD